MRAVDIKEIISILPSIFIYILPGYIVLWIKSFLLSQNMGKGDHAITKSILLSYIIITVEKFIFKLIGINQSNSFFDETLIFKVITILVSVLIGYGVGRFLVSNLCCKILKKLGINKSLHPGIWSDLADLEYGLWISVFVPNESVIYNGKLRKFEETDGNENYFILLSNYTCYSYSAEPIINYSNDNSKWVAINTKDISRIEIFYHSKSKKIDRFNYDNEILAGESEDSSIKEGSI